MPVSTIPLTSAVSGTLPLANGGSATSNPPAFSAYVSTVQSIGSQTWTKITFATEEFDTNNNFASSRFTPTVAGYYQVNAQIQPDAFYTGIAIAIYKNGSVFKYGNFVFVTSVGGSVVSTLIYMNGTTDYIECYGAFAGSAQAVSGGPAFSYFQACLLRTA